MQTKIDAGEFAWKDIAGDPIHPNPRGHAVYAEAVTAMLEQQAQLGDKPTPAPTVPRPFFGDEFTTATLLPIAAAKVSAPSGESYCLRDGPASSWMKCTGQTAPERP